MFKVIIVGGKDVKDNALFTSKCVTILRNKASEGITIYSTGDEVVEEFAHKFRIDVRTFPANWNKYGHEALIVRNKDMLETCDALIAFNKGLKDIQLLIDMAEEKKKPTRVIKV